jgi:hypothetical protein
MGLVHRGRGMCDRVKVSRGGWRAARPPRSNSKFLMTIVSGATAGGQLRRRCRVAAASKIRPAVGAALEMSCRWTALFETLAQQSH